MCGLLRWERWFELRIEREQASLMSAMAGSAGGINRHGADVNDAGVLKILDSLKTRIF
jgi:hypothetical protein